MPSTYTASLRFELQGTGENLNNWGTRLNTALSRVDKAIAGRSAITLAGGVYTLSSSNTSDDEARSAFLDLSGVGGGSLLIPSVSKLYHIRNASDGPVTVTTGAGTTVTIDATDIVDIVCDGTNVRTLGFNGQDLKSYIAASALAATGSLPATAGHNGKFLGVVAGSWVPKLLTVSDISDAAANIRGFAIAMAIAL